MNPYGFQEVEQEFLDVMPLSCRIYRGGVIIDEYGRMGTEDTYYEVPAHAEMKAEEILTSDGTARAIAGKLYLGYVIPWLSTADRLDIVDLKDGWRTTIIAAVDAREGPDGIHHQEVYFGQRGATTRGMGA